LPRILVDAVAIRRYPEFRRLLIGFALSQVGAQLGIVAIAYQIYRITGSVFDVGLVSLIQIVPTFCAAVVGGSMADTMNRRTLLLVTEAAIVCCSAGLALDSASGHAALWLLYALAAGGAAASGIDAPTRNAVLVTIVDREAWISANSARQLTQKIGVVVGPALGGLLLASFDVTVVYSIEAASFLAAMATVMAVRARPPADAASRLGVRSIIEAFTYFKGRQALQGCFAADLNAMVLGMPTSLFPAIGIRDFHGGAGNVGLLFAAPGLGALAISVLSGWTATIRRPGLAVCVAITLWGTAIAAFGLSGSFPLSLGFLAFAGAADVISVLFLSMIIQIETPERLRGRILSLQTGVLGNGPRLGSMESGFVAALAGVEFAIVSGGIGCMLGIALIARRMPRFTHYEFDAPGDVALPGIADPPVAPT